MQLSELGTITNDCLTEISNHFPEVEVWNYVIMPNHLHFIIVGGARHIAPAANKQSLTQANMGCLKPPMHGNPTHDYHHNSLLARIVGTFKAAVTREYNKRMRARGIAPIPHIWQRLYHENIIRNQQSFDNMVNYIETNVENWLNDCFYPIPPHQPNIPYKNH